MPVYRYLDLSPSHITGAEYAAIEERLSDLECESPRVITHEFGAWVNVYELDAVDDDAPIELAERYPNLAACLDKARELDCNWINFDQDASCHEGLPTVDW